jgi:hypothetical protein
MDDIKLKEYQTEALACDLPKWPQMVVWGTPVSPDQALEVIRRTDSFFHNYSSGGNDEMWNRRAKEIVGYPETDYSLKGRALMASFDAQREWGKRWGVIETEYVRNSWLSSAYIGGPHGWCHPDGKIHNTTNVGKWPDASDVFKDWIRLARAFPFLDLCAVLMSGENCEEDTTQALVIDVSNGVVSARTPNGSNPFERFGMDFEVARRSRKIEDMVGMLALSPRFREHRFGLDQIRRWADQVNQ